MLRYDPEVLAALEGTIREFGAPYVRGLTWTTDAYYRETRGKVARRAAEGCLTVEMEASAYLAVAKFRGVKLGQILYGGDDVSGEAWDQRNWTSRGDVRRGLLSLALEASLRPVSYTHLDVYKRQIITMVLPSLAAARVSVVEHKRKKSRSAGQTFWKKYFLDFILLAISLYGYYSYQQRSEILSITNVSGVEIPIDPVLFIISTTFIIGLGMVLLRLYPYVVRLIYFIGRKRWGAVSYTCLLYTSWRSSPRRWAASSPTSPIWPWVTMCPPARSCSPSPTPAS